MDIARFLWLDVHRYKGGTTKVSSGAKTAPFARLLRYFDGNIQLFTELISSQQALGIANSTRIDQWVILRLELEDLEAERKATGQLAERLAMRYQVG